MDTEQKEWQKVDVHEYQDPHCGRKDILSWTIKRTFYIIPPNTYVNLG